MLKLLLIVVLLIISTCLEVAQFASLLPEESGTTTISPPISHDNNSSPTATTNESTTTTLDPNADPDDILSPNSTPGKGLPNGITLSPTNNNNDPNNNNNKAGGQPDKVATNKSKPLSSPPDSSGNILSSANIELNVLFYSIFIVYISFIKLIYHNVALIKRNLTEPGILIVFGIIWELVLRQLSETYESTPRFNSRIFFYLFLPSTVLESASLLSNKWLFLNLLPILIHSIIGTLIYASSLGFSIYALSRHNVFNLSPSHQQSSSQQAALFSGLQMMELNSIVSIINIPSSNNSSESSSLGRESGLDWLTGEFADSTIPPSPSPLPSPPSSSSSSPSSSSQLNLASFVSSTSSIELNNLTLADCLIFGTILSSVDSTIMLNAFSQFQVNDKLYYLVLGENLMNNAVVIVIFDCLLEFFNATRLTVVKIYIAIIRFFATLFGSIFIGLILAGVALISLRLTKRFQVPTSPSTSYQNQCLAMAETLFILKLAYLTYTLAGLAGTSSIVSLATFGILQDQYIKHNLNLRSQLTLRQVVLAAKNMGYSLVYPLLGMLLVEVANSSQFFHNWLEQPATTTTTSIPLGPSSSSSSSSSLGLPNLQQNNNNPNTFNSVSDSKFSSNLANQANLSWNFKFLSLVTLITLVIRFIVVFAMSIFCNLFSSSQLKIKFREQLLLAYGGLKGPLAFALVNRLVEHEEYRDQQTILNKHLFMYTILFITFLSSLVKGSFIRPLVSKMQHFLSQSKQIQQTQTQIRSNPPLDTISNHQTIVFDKINCKVTEYLTHGLNSILGHTKSPYERFVELNETHIKPWLTRNDSNTNWLSVFYDSLILDETLNANCFYRSTTEIDPIIQAYWRSKTKNSSGDDGSRYSIRHYHHNKGKQLSPRQPTNKLLQTDTISAKGEHLPVIRRRRHSKGEVGPPPPLQMQLSLNNKQAPDFIQSLSKPESSALKELVLFNLKVQNARKRRQIRRQQVSTATRLRTSRVEPKPMSLDYGEEQSSFNSMQRKRISRMLSTTSSNDDDLLGATGKIVQLGETSSFEAKKLAHHMIEIERRFDAVDELQRTIGPLAQENLIETTLSQNAFNVRQPPPPPPLKSRRSHGHAARQRRQPGINVNSNNNNNNNNNNQRRSHRQPPPLASPIDQGNQAHLYRRN